MLQSTKHEAHLAMPKSAILQTLFSQTRMFRAARSRCTQRLLDKNSIPFDTCQAMFRRSRSSSISGSMMSSAVTPMEEDEDRI